MSFFNVISNIFRLRFRCIKTLWFNLKIFDFKDAIKLPVFLFGNVEFEDLHRGCIKLERKAAGTVRIGGGVYTSLFGHSQLYKTYMSVKGSICFGSGVILDQGCILSVSKGAEIIFGSNIYVNRCTKIHAKESIRIGDNCRIGWNCQIFDTNFHYSIINGRINNKNSAVVLEHNVWLANGVTVGKGVKLPPFSVVASNSLVNKDYCDKGEGWLFGGVPAKPIISCIKRILDKEKVLDSYFEDGKDFVMYDEVKSVLGGQ